MDCKIASAAERVCDCGAGVQWPNEGSRSFSCRMSLLSQFRLLRHCWGELSPHHNVADGISRRTKPAVWKEIGCRWRAPFKNLWRPGTYCGCEQCAGPTRRAKSRSAIETMRLYNCVSLWSVTKKSISAQLGQVHACIARAYLHPLSHFAGIHWFAHSSKKLHSKGFHCALGQFSGCLHYQRNRCVYNGWLSPWLPDS